MIQKLPHYILILLIFSPPVLGLPTIENSNRERTLNPVRNDKLNFLLVDTPTLDNLKEALLYYNIKFPEIVYAQAILETGYLKSRVCREYNNLFGLYNSRRRDYYKFNHWSESVIAYDKYIQYKYKEGEDYYQFLSRIGYAEDPLYINKLKIIVKRNKQESN